MIPRFAAHLSVPWLLACFSVVDGAAAERPNVILIMTDDQGIGDFGAMGNEAFQTPHIDAMAQRSATMTTFYVSPVCSPTRACLLTGRYNYRTRCIDTWLGRSMMDPDEETVAEVLGKAGYATGIFGKWHLGDCYPMRPNDQGFQEALVHRGGGLAQPSEPRENQRRYTDPILFHNGHQVQTEGYCTDVYFDAAINFIDKSRANGKNFFVYLPTNAPHDPLHDVPEELRRFYMKRTAALKSLVRGAGAPRQRDQDIDRLARIAAMITNIDQNVGRLFAHLESLQLTENTLVIFLVDNGPNSMRYVGELRGMKSHVHEGGIRSPLWLHWPARLTAKYACNRLAAHIDLMPTILEACGITAANRWPLDGRSLLPLLEGRPVDWPARSIVIQSHRGDEPVRYHHFMIRDARWKLLHASGFGREGFDGQPQFELYDMQHDPGESNNLASQHPEVLNRLKKQYDVWFDDVSSTRPDNYAPPRIHVGSPHENPTVLTRQDWRRGTWEPNSSGHWQVFVERAGIYDIQFEYEPGRADELATLRIGETVRRQTVAGGETSCQFRNVRLSAGNTDIEGSLTEAGKLRGVYQLFVNRHGN